MPTPQTVILVVEDEILIRMDVADYLTAQGYIVLEAATGREALAAIEGAERVNLVFTDVDMPGDLDGLMLAHEVERKWPAIAIIVTSGKNPLGMSELPANSRFYTKPYMLETLQTAIKDMLARPSQS